MNDNLRYISLQYIKGDNYEEIICFKYNLIRDILDDKDNFRKDISNDILRDLKNAIDEDNKCYIGESFLNDLVNYYNFKDIKDKIKEVRGVVEDYKKRLNSTEEEANEDIRDAKKTSNDIIKSLKELVEVLKTPHLKINNIGLNMTKTKTKKDGDEEGNANDDANDDGNANDDANANADADDEAKIYAAKTALDKYKEVKKLLDGVHLTNLDDIENREEGGDDISKEDLMKGIKDSITDAIDSDDDTKDHIEIKNRIIEGINSITKSKTGQKYDLIKLLLTLRKVFLYENEQDTFKSQAEIENADKLLVLFKTYTKICNRNIDKFDRLFKQNDIIDIDEAFMIESYASFLNKLKKLKKSLESKDKGKLERALTKSLNKLFNLYGINDYEKILNGDAADAADTNGTEAQKYINKLIEDY